MSESSRIDELFEAARLGDAERLKAMLAADPGLAGAENRDGLTPLGFAAHYGQAAAVEALLAAGADVNEVSHSRVAYIPSNTALHAAMAGERSMEVIRLLLDNGARTDIPDSSGQTCLHSAAYHMDSKELISLLIKRGADINKRDTNGETALDLARKQGHAEAAAALEAAGALES